MTAIVGAVLLAVALPPHLAPLALHLTGVGTRTMAGGH